ncbi:sugar transferase [Rhodobacteraceae bacterium 2CG4]|uniref:Sugar transferase n=1 Tax=Halovulum marinum TaxID=2662447 RepID=A0A6L5Z5C6_9RHOB|nr:sugar transferase [Halovulum marinum]MSU91733.1 sugar transferase [Halovulum marinum]
MVGATDSLAPLKSGRERHSSTGLYAQFGKRLLDITLVLLAMPIVLPLIAGLAVWIGLQGHSPFFVQDRVGKGGGVFRLWKLRTMVPDAEAALEAYLSANPEARREWDTRQKLAHDPRILPCGHFLRAASLDELPQLWNVLKGDMSLIGPRPMMPSQVRLYPGRAYYALRPGISGLWQVSQRNECSFEGRSSYDTEYFHRLSLPTDLGVLLRTVSVVLRRTGT